MQSFGLTINREKCEFGKYEIEFYGHRFTKNGLKPSQEKVKALKECGEPTTKEGVRSFLQMVGYKSTSNVSGGLCVILTQQDEKGVWRMCNVANRTSTDIETRYGQTELEALAIKWACSDVFYQFLVGASKFEILTDCEPLVHLFNNPKSRAPIRIER